MGWSRAARSPTSTTTPAQLQCGERTARRCWALTRRPRPGTSTNLGQMSLHFTDATHGTLMWPGGVIQIVRQPFGSGDASFQPSGWWYNAAENGRGFSIEVQGNTLDVVGFMYDGNGNPVWYISSGPHGLAHPLRRPSRPDRRRPDDDGGPTRRPRRSPPVGFIAIDFASLETGYESCCPTRVAENRWSRPSNNPAESRTRRSSSLAANWAGPIRGNADQRPAGCRRRDRNRDGRRHVGRRGRGTGQRNRLSDDGRHPTGPT